MYAFRRLGPGDIAGFRAMNDLFGQVFDLADEYGGAPPTDDYAHQWLGNPSNIAVIAEEDGMTIGALGGYVLHKFEQQRAEVFIYDLAVSADHRRRGIATGMIDVARQIARDAGAWTLFIQADAMEEDAPARALYRKLAREEIMAHHFDIDP